LRILPGVSVFAGRIAAKSDALCRQLQSLISPALGVPTKIVGFDLSRHNLEGPVPDIQVQQVGGTAIGQSVVAVAWREGLTIRQRQIATSCNRSRSHDLPAA
jgi:hypothetical protein